jgi:hypothetical protein
VLKSGDEANRAARPDWDDELWAQWGGITRVWLGGGLASGELGRRLRDAAQALLHEAGVHRLALHVSPYGAALPLLGLSRHVPDETSRARLYDFGHTAIKAGWATYQQGEVVALHSLERQPAPPDILTSPGDDPAREAASAQALADSIVARVVADLRNVADAAESVDQTRVVRICLACYLRPDGQPYNTATYGKLKLVADPAQDWLAAEISRRLGKPVDLRLMHDGTAAASAYAGQPAAAILMLGTAIGIGFPPPASEARPLAEGLAVDENWTIR